MPPTTPMEYLASKTPELPLDEEVLKDYENDVGSKHSISKYLETAGPEKPDGGAADVNDQDEYYPEGGRGWGVVLGCFLLCSITLSKFFQLPRLQDRSKTD